MSPLFSEAGDRRLDEAARPGLLCAFDFDGTLAPIVAQPEHAQLPAEIRQQLLALAECAPVAIITGRSVTDIVGRLGFVPDFVIGNHGLEGVPGWETHAQRHQALCVGWRAQLTRALERERHDPQIRLEDKGYSLSVHYRNAGADAPARLNRLFGALEPAPRVVSGKYVFNLVPPDAAHKGQALAQLMKNCGARQALYVGDDVTDEDVFRLPRQDVLSVRIEYAAGSAAEFYLPHPPDIARLLEELTARLHARGASNWLAAAAASSA